METKVLLMILNGIGWGSCVGGILLNLANWKSNILFFTAFSFMLLKIARFGIKTYQAYKREEIEQQILKKKIENSE